jgi:hypothetical protein
MENTADRCRGAKPDGTMGDTKMADWQWPIKRREAARAGGVRIYVGEGEEITLAEQITR